MTQTNPAPLTVLIVEDDPLMRWSVAETLTAEGEAIVEAPDGASAIQAIADATRPFDVALLDVRLPDSDGLTLLATIRRQSPSTGVVVMTAFGTPEIVDGAQALGARRVVSKPFNMDDVEGIVRSAAAA